LESSIKNLRILEKEIFPKPKEEIQVVDKETGEVVEGASNETTPPQDTGGIN
jgi:hypothetical protein